MMSVEQEVSKRWQIAQSALNIFVARESQAQVRVMKEVQQQVSERLSVMLGDSEWELGDLCDFVLLEGCSGSLSAQRAPAGYLRLTGRQRKISSTLAEGSQKRRRRYTGRRSKHSKPGGGSVGEGECCQACAGNLHSGGALGGDLALLSRGERGSVSANRFVCDMMTVGAQISFATQSSQANLKEASFEEAIIEEGASRMERLR